MRVRVDDDLCISSGNCVLTAPEVFGQDDDGVVELLDAEPPPERHEAVRNAEARCPAAVIQVEE